MLKKPSEIAEILKARMANFDGDASVQEIGRVISVGDGIAKVWGLSSVMMNEIVDFAGGTIGVVIDLDIDAVGVMLFGKGLDVSEGEIVTRGKRVMEVPVGPELLGRVVDGIGRPVDGKGPISAKMQDAVEKEAPGIMARQPICNPMETGLLVIDAMVPIGLGQRELIIGDRKTGKTSIAINAIINQLTSNHDDRICVYVAIGKKNSSIAKLADFMKKRGVMDKVIIVAATASDSVASQLIAPYTGCTMAEYFRDRGQHAIVVYDDLSQHAIAYRQVALLLRRPPGREAYPGDVFYLHARLLERAAKMSDEKGGGSLTALPIVETQEGDMSAYIPTNIISITDGQIVMDTGLFYKGVRPAVYVEQSISRIGSSAQSPAMKKASKSQKIEYAQYREMESFARFATDLDPSTKKILDRGARVEAMLKQGQYDPQPLPAEVLAFLSESFGFLEQCPVERVGEFLRDMTEFFKTNHKDIWDTIDTTGDFSADDEKKIKKIMGEAAPLIISGGNGVDKSTSQ